MGLKYGQLANRLFAFSHFIANAIENSYSLVNPTFDEYREYFDATRDDDFGEHAISTRYNASYPVLERAVPYIKKYFPRSWFHCFIEYYDNADAYDLNDVSYVTNAKSKMTIVNGWPFRDYKNFSKHSDTIRKIFTPSAIYQNNVEILHDECKSGDVILVGVHIRKADYKTWNQGKYYYSDDIYLDKMAQIESHFRKLGKVVKFLVCSDENISSTKFSFPNIVSGSGHLIEDLYSLSKCDYIIGPPSSYSMWASFYGKVPLFHFVQATQELDFNSFKVNVG